MEALTGVTQLGIIPQSERSPVRFRGRARAGAAGSPPSRHRREAAGRCSSTTPMFLSLPSPSLPSLSQKYREG